VLDTHPVFVNSYSKLLFTSSPNIDGFYRILSLLDPANNFQSPHMKRVATFQK